MKTPGKILRATICGGALLAAVRLAIAPVYSQVAPAAPAQTEPENAGKPQAVIPSTTSASSSSGSEQAIVLSPFEVTTDQDTGFVASGSLAGGRLATELRDTPVAYSVMTREFIDALAITDLLEASHWMTGTTERITAFGGGGDVFGNTGEFNIRGFISGGGGGGTGTPRINGLLHEPTVAKGTDYGLRMELFQRRLDLNFTYYESAEINAIDGTQFDVFSVLIRANAKGDQSDPGFNIQGVPALPIVYYIAIARAAAPKASRSRLPTTPPMPSGPTGNYSKSRIPGPGEGQSSTTISNGETYWRTTPSKPGFSNACGSAPASVITANEPSAIAPTTRSSTRPIPPRQSTIRRWTALRGFRGRLTPSAPPPSPTCGNSTTAAYSWPIWSSTTCGTSANRFISKRSSGPKTATTPRPCMAA